ncbi:hypothetical protein [uncultured Draconibacterium sp.]|uniref:hypothetical protein n=1 Tax=uncultured Draconibacterium sp. TaxID=1573823 RepID=UPI003217CAB8
MEKVLFKEEQRFTQWWLWLILGSTLLAIIFPLVNELLTQSLDTSPEGVLRLVLIGVMSLLFIVAVLIVLLLTRLKTKIRNNEILVAYPPFKRKWLKITADEIERFEIRKYRAIREYGGYGFRSKRRIGQAYIISGNFGLQLYLKNGKKLLIGTQKKQALEYAMDKIMEPSKKVLQGEKKKPETQWSFFGRKTKKVLIILAIEVVIAILVLGIIQLKK